MSATSLPPSAGKLKPGALSPTSKLIVSILPRLVVVGSRSPGTGEIAIDAVLGIAPPLDRLLEAPHEVVREPHPDVALVPIIVVVARPDRRNAEIDHRHLRMQVLAREAALALLDALAFLGTIIQEGGDV